MSVPFPERKVSVRVLQDLGATNETVLEVVKKGSCAEARVDDTGKRTPVIIRKADSYPIQSLLDKLESFNVPFQGFTDFFVFADLNLQEVAKVEAIPEVDRVFPDEKVTGYLDCSCETTKARATWNTFGHYGEDITWAVVDSGINDSHPHFAGPNALLQRGSYPNWWQNFEQKEWFKEKFQGPKMKINIEPGYPNNRVVLRIHLVNGGNINPHGTHVAGIIAGKQPEGEAEVEIPNGTPIRVKGIQGLAPQAKLVDFRVLDADATGIASDAISALYIIRKINEEAGNTVIAGANLSLGYETILWVWEFGVGSSPLCEEVDRLVHSGVLVVVAAGNAGFAEFAATTLSDTGLRAPVRRTLFNFQSITDPGNAREAITVGSTHRRSPHRWGPSFFSSRGPTGDGRLKPDLLAPGEKITSCNSIFSVGQEVPLLYLRLSGTSQAAAMVSGALALFLSIHTEFIGRPSEVKEKLLASCTDLQREPYLQGHGLLDLFRLIQSV